MSAQPAVADVLRELAPRVLGAVVRRCGDFTAAEDAVQEALLAAFAEWPAGGMPDNPGGWLYQVSCRRLLDHGDRERARRRREAVAGEQRAAQELEEPNVNGDGWTDEDDTLVLLFTCCHPALTKPSAIALTLRAVGGLTTKEIAGAFFVPEATMAQRISRGKQSIEESGVPFRMPEADERARRVDAVLHVLYLIFNEGYASSSGGDLVRVELSAEAIRLVRLLHRLLPEHAEVTGLLALLLLTDARRIARTGPRGELIPLDEQDRSRWDRRAIDEGTSLATSALAKGNVGSYQLQAAIAALHDEAASTDTTDWPQILALYGLLRRMSDNPMVELNHAIATAMVHGPAAGLVLLDAIAKGGHLAGSHRLDAVRAHLVERTGDRTAAAALYRAAAARTGSVPERQYLLVKAARLDPPLA